MSKHRKKARRKAKPAEPARSVGKAIRTTLLGSETLAIEYKHAATGERMRHVFKHTGAGRPPLYVTIEGDALIIQPVKAVKFIGD